MNLRIIETGRILKRENVELVDLFDTGGSPNAENWEWVALKVRKPDAALIITTFESEQILRKTIPQLIAQRNAARAVAEAARNYAAATAGLDGTAEGAALLAAIKEMEKDNDN